MGQSRLYDTRSAVEHDSERDVMAVPAGMLNATQSRTLLRGVPGSTHDEDNDQLLVPLNGSRFAAATVADVVLSDQQLTGALPPTLRTRLLDALQLEAAFVAASTQLHAPPGYREQVEPQLPAPMRGVMKDYQFAAHWYINRVADGRGFLGDDPGAGKTMIALSIVATRGGPTVVVCKAALKSVMEDEIYKWVGADTSVHVLEGRSGDGDGLPAAEFYIVNYDILHYRYEELLAVGPRALIVDESQNIKTEGKNDTKARAWLAMDAEERKANKKANPKEGSWRTWATKLLAWSDTIDTVLLASATPSPNGRNIEWMPQIDVLGQLEEFGGRRMFVGRYARRCIKCIDSPQPPKHCPHDPVELFKMKGRRVENTFGSLNSAELSRRLRSTMMVRRSQRQLMPQLDPIQPITVPVPLTTEGEKDYRKAEQEFLEWLKDYAAQKAREEGTSVKQAIARAMRAGKSDNQLLMQRTYLRQAAARAKMKNVVEWLTDLIAEDTETHLPRKVIVFAWHRDVQQQLIDELTPVVASYRARSIDDSKARKRAIESYAGVPSILSASDMSADDIRAATKRFQEDPEEPVIVCSLAAASEGHTLTAAWHVAFVEQPNEAARMRQAVGRCYGRSNDPHPATAYSLLGIGTIDEPHDEALDSKKALMAATLDEGRSLEWAEARVEELDGVEVEATALEALLAKLG